MFLYLCCPAASRRRLPLQRVDFLCAVGLSLSLGFQAVGIYHLLGAYLAKATVSERTCCGSHQSGCYLLGSSSHCHKHYSLFGSSCLLYGRRWDDSTQSLGAGIRFSVGVALSSHLFVLFLLFQLYEDLYDDNTGPKGVGVGCVVCD